MQDVYIFGSSGHAKVVIDICQRLNFKISGIVGIDPNQKTFQNIPIIQESDFLQNKTGKKGIVAVGDNFQRQKIVQNILKNIPDFEFISAVDPRADISNAEIGPGTVVMKNVSINVDSKIGQHAIINTASIIDHDGRIGDFSSIAPGAKLGGNVTIGEVTAICIGAILSHQVSVGNHTIVGAGSVVLKNIKDNQLAYGVPCKEISSRSAGDNYLN